HIGNVDRPARKRDATCNRSPIRPERVTPHIFDVMGREAVAGDVMVDAVPCKPDGRPVSATQPRCRFDQRIEHGLQIEGRSADNFEHVGGRGLLLQRLAQLIEQARILDGDDGLGREVGDQLDLLIAERSDLLAINDDGADKLVFLEHGNAKEGSATSDFDCGDAQRIAFGIGRFGSEVRNVNDLLRIEDSAKASLWAGKYWSTIPQLAIRLWNIM